MSTSGLLLETISMDSCYDAAQIIYNRFHRCFTWSLIIVCTVESLIIGLYDKISKTAKRTGEKCTEISVKIA